MSLMFAALLGSAVASAAPACPDGYSRYDNKSEVLGCQRHVPGSSYREYLVLTKLALPPDRVIDEMWSRILRSIVGGLKRRDFIVKEPRRIVFYDQIKTPVVSDRDYTVEAERQPDQPSGRREITFRLRNELGPPLDGHHTRIPSLHAAWTLDPDGQGGTRLAYTSYSEPGGSVPAWMVRGAQAKHAMTDVLDLLDALGVR
jgi:hypothetical protein